MATSAAVVVGIDGSDSAIDAAVWAVDEAVSRDIPLRLVFALSPNESAHQLAAAENAVQAACARVDATDRPVKLEAEIVRDPAVRALEDASRQAQMLCVGSVGLTHGGLTRMGSTAAALATSAHCPLAIIHPAGREPGWVVVEVGEDPATDVALRRGVEEALLRRCALRVVTTWPSRYTDIHDAGAVADGNRLARRRLDRRLTTWRVRFPDLDIQAVASPGSFVNYLARHVRSIRLVVVPHERADAIAELIGPPQQGMPGDLGFDVLLCEPHCRTSSSEQLG
ncbi:universal stress protein UspA [Mycolicibacterium chubuense]|uniref:Universal stress protein n=1 Tax=Mycolicibacterium chubuense TaxID=1800 RepID=A0A0J6WJG6_MYCCU|nr:universal stress protein [Mycolicibacterium chubuense]KMO82739.1 Universal stress protein [Mycolicibacterium chubuense]ORA44436.1 universal stress protein UspA [Mycolicibacterium chubuense]SPY00587.1 UspA domain-containing protein [Mycolicibacterium chubuense]